MIVHDSWWSNGSARLTIIDYHEPFDQGLKLKALSRGCHASALADHVISTGHNIKWDHFDILTTGKSDLQCKIKETLLISELKPSLNENIGSEKLFLY